MKEEKWSIVLYAIDCPFRAYSIVCGLKEMECNEEICPIKKITCGVINENMHGVRLTVPRRYE